MAPVELAHQRLSSAFFPTPASGWDTRSCRGTPVPSWPPALPGMEPFLVATWSPLHWSRPGSAREGCTVHPWQNYIGPFQPTWHRP